MGLKAEAQKPLHVFYDAEIVGEFKAGVIVEDLIILELKSVRRIVTAFESQLVNYLTATHKDVGLIIYFGEKKVEIKRKACPEPAEGYENYPKMEPSNKQDQQDKYNPVNPVDPVKK